MRTMSSRDDFSRRIFLQRAAASGLLVSSSGLLAACSPGGDSGSKKLTDVKPSDAEGSVVIWDRSGDLYDVFDATIAGFNEKYPRVKVDHVAVDVDEKLLPALVSGTGLPDGAFLDDVKVPGQAAHLTDVGELMASYRDQIVQYKLDVNTVDGRIVGIPWDLDPSLLWYREDVLDKAGVDPDALTTYDALLDGARTIRDRDPGARPIHLDRDPFLGQLWFEMLANQQGTSMAGPDGELRLESPEYQRITRWIKQVVDEGLGNRAAYTQPGDLHAYDSGRQSLMPWASWWVYVPQTLLKESKGRWRAAPLPAWTPGGARSGVMGGASFVIPAKAKNPRLAWLYYEHLLFSPEGYGAVYGPSSVYPGGLNTSLPSFEPALDPAKPLYETIPELGGQDLWKVNVTAAAEVPGGYTIPAWWAQAVDYLGTNIQKLMDGKMEPDDVLSESAAAIQKNLVDRA